MEKTKYVAPKARNIPGDAASGYQTGDGCDAAYEAADAIVKHIPELVNNDAERDFLEAAIRDLIYDINVGKVNFDTVGIEEDQYDANGNAL